MPAVLQARPVSESCFLKHYMGQEQLFCCNLSDLCNQSYKIPLDRETCLKLHSLGKWGVCTWLHVATSFFISLTFQKQRASFAAGIPPSPKQNKHAHDVHGQYSEISGSAHTQPVHHICTTNASLRHWLHHGHTVIPTDQQLSWHYSIGFHMLGPDRSIPKFLFS